jgi:hypothetical protein
VIFGSSISRSITELNSDSHQRPTVAIRNGTSANETFESRGTAPFLDTAAPRGADPALRGTPEPLSFAAAPVAASMRTLAPYPERGARGPVFISVNGQCPVRSALRSDMRQSKRISGVAAATEPPHAPMNSPVCPLGGRVSLTIVH